MKKYERMDGHPNTVLYSKGLKQKQGKETYDTRTTTNTQNSMKA